MRTGTFAKHQVEAFVGIACINAHLAWLLTPPLFMLAHAWS